MTDPDFDEMIGFQSELQEPAFGAPEAPDLDCTALFLDVDGTLVEIAERPDAVLVPDATRTLLRNLHHRTDGATALVSGRRIGDLDQFFPDFEGIIVGSHGAEWRDSGKLWRHSAQDSSDLARLVQMVRAWSASEPDVLFEEKPCSVVLHFRQAPDRMAEGLKFMESITNHVEGFVLHQAKMAAEIHPEDVSKRHAIETLLERWPTRMPVSFGDDLTDEGMFEVTNRFGGLSIKVGEGKTGARFRLAGPAEVTDTLGDWLGVQSR